MNTESAEDVRQQSLSELAVLGFPQPPAHFPLLEKKPIRSQHEVVARALVLNVVINCAYQMPNDYARSWLRGQGLFEKATLQELAFMDGIDQGEQPDTGGFELQIEALWALAWSLGFVDDLSFSQYCTDELAGWLPDLRRNEGKDRFERAAVLVERDKVREALDLCFCLTWGAAEANLERRRCPGPVEQYVLWERRRALEWLRGEDWDDYPTDT